MTKLLRPLMALIMAATFGWATAEARDFSGYANDSYASQVNYDSFNNTVRKRMETLRIGSYTQSFGTAAMFSSDEAYAMAPSSRSTSYSSARRRQLDCAYTNGGFTIWGDVYQTWARQRVKDGSEGYKHRVFGPAIGFDWSSGPFTIGVAATYGWGKMKARDMHHDRKTRMWAVDLYGQYDAEMFYINATLGYGHNRFRSSRTSPDSSGTVYQNVGDKYNANSFNIDAEFGWKFCFNNFKVIPHAGIRYFHDRKGSVRESGYVLLVDGSSRNYHSVEIPLGVNLEYEINMGGAIIVPRIRAAWVPELSRKRGEITGDIVDGNTGLRSPYHENAARRNRHGFVLGAGLEAKISRNISAHIDYQCNFRSKSYQHFWNAGLGFTF